MTMKVVNEFGVLKCIYDGVEWDRIWNDYDSLMYSHDYISFFTNYQAREMNSIWLGKKISLKELEEKKD